MTAEDHSPTARPSRTAETPRTAEQLRTATLAAQWLRHTDDGETTLATALSTISRRTQDQPVPWIAGLVSTTDLTVRTRAQLGLGSAAAELSVSSAIQGTASTTVTYDIAQRSGMPKPWPLDRFTDVGVIAEHTGLSPDTVEDMVTRLGQAARLVAHTAYLHVADVGVEQVQAELAPRLGAVQQPTAVQIDALSVLAEQHARAQAAVDLNTAYVELARAAQAAEPDRLSPAGLSNQLGSPQTQIDYELSELIVEHWRTVYASALNEALGVVPAADTPTERAMQAKLAEQAERDARRSAFPQSAKDQLGHLPPAADHDNPSAPPNPFNQPPERDPDQGRDDDGRGR